MPPKKGKAAKPKTKQPDSTANGAVESSTNGTVEPSPTEAPEQTANIDDTKAADAPAPPVANDSADVAETKTDDAPAPAAQPEATAEPEAEAKPEPAKKANKSKKRKAVEEPAKAPEVAKEPSPEIEEKATNKTEETAMEKIEQKPADKLEEGTANEDGDTSAEKPAKKRKTEPKPVREGERKSGRGAPKDTASQEQILRYLLSDSAAALCRPEDETSDLEKGGSAFKAYSSSVLSPFEELVCALVLSRPISHRLGMRTIRTILNDPYNFTSPKSIIDAGKEKRHQALVDAKTQHKDKTAEQIGLIADVVSTKFGTDNSLNEVREQGYRDWDSERDLLQTNIKGLGKTGLDIFYRRVQWLWEEAFPFIDDRTARGVDKLGLPKNADTLFKLLEEHWSKMDSGSLAGDDEAAKKRRAFVILCERATGADLEGKTDDVMRIAAQQ